MATRRPPATASRSKESAEQVQLSAEVDRYRGNRQVADRGCPGVAPDRHPRGAGGVTDDAEGKDWDQPHRDQGLSAAALDSRLDPLEALGAEPAVEQWPCHGAPDEEAG